MQNEIVSKLPSTGQGFLFHKKYGSLFLCSQCIYIFFTWTFKGQKVKPSPELLFLTGIFLKRYFHSKMTIFFNTSTANSLQCMIKQHRRLARSRTFNSVAQKPRRMTGIGIFSHIFPLSRSFIHFLPLSPHHIHFHPLLCTSFNFHPNSSTFIHFFQLSSQFIHFNSAAKSLIFIRAYSYIRVFEEKYSYFTRIFVIYSYFL